ncbi:MAG TPA: tripartite tricarboxylate transporter TctB family protein [Kiloniellaceae bacterium]|nr:tripartite tricarboxylate transporter TctB family protein [Kiloniellaceae bacterium]HIP77165.1 tripartite tricarboxylate transporter TctB family protein [Kiloniellaceae bacterium]
MDKNRIAGVVMLLFFGGYALASFDIALPVYLQSTLFNARSMPQAYAICGIALSLVLILLPSGRALRLSAFHFAPFAALCGIMVAFGFLVRPLGFLLATVLLLTSGFVLLGERRPAVILAVALPVAVGFWTVLTQLLGVFIAPWPDL